MFEKYNKTRSDPDIYSSNWKANQEAFLDALASLRPILEIK